jgi:ABC-type uncharacterized transport system permease subunit
MQIFFIISTVIFIGSAIICHAIAGKRGANRVRWGIIGALLGPIAIPFAYFAKPQKESQNRGLS